ncbi:ROS1-like isoform X1 [Olea europaea subsp. europaea]|uniref:ROS1-like isoform X1 n=2 Tax=Olea europaea subsp. europaea TaxID=158383 RepID=A0A8S0U6Z3_OLEEU|nr:ROS1-like isoform X1 [Olea europaea subsp. europaea]
MDEKQKGLVSELEDLQTGCSWVPLTPAKPGPICTEWQDNQAFRTNGLESEKYLQVNHTGQAEIGPKRASEEFLQENPAACWGSANAINIHRNFNTRETDIAPKSQVNGDDSCRSNFSVNVNDEEMWNSVSFRELLALADAASFNASAQTAFNATSSSFAPNFHTKIDSRQCTITTENPSLVDLDTSLGINFPAECNSIQNIPNDGSCIRSRLFFDLNFPSRMADATFSEVVSSQFAPITPEKNPKTDERRGLAMPNLSTDEMLGKKDVKQKEIAIKRVGLEGFLQMKEHSQLVVDHVCETMSTQLEENHKPDKGGTEDIELNKTPQQKPRRKKHRPKVIIEGQSQIIPKPSVGRPSDPQETTRVKRKYVRRKGLNNHKTETPLEREINESDTNTKAPSSKETMTGKRKYVRRKGVNKPAATTLDQETCETKDPKTVQHTRNTCRRSLKFDVEGQGSDESSLHHHPSPNFDMESQAQNFNAKDQSGSTIQCIQGREASLKKTEVIAYDLTCSTKQVVEGYLSKPEGHSSSPPPHSKTDTLNDKSTLTDQKVCTRGKCQIIFSDFTHDEEGNNLQLIMNSDARSTQKSSSNSDSSNTACLMQERQERGIKRQHRGTTVEAEFYRSNSTGTLHNSLQAYSAIFQQFTDNNYCNPGMHFHAIYSTKRIEKEHNSVTSSTNSTAIASENRAIAAADGTQNEQKKLKFLAAMGPTERLEKKRSKEPAPVWNSVQPLEIRGQLPASTGSGATTSKIAQGFEILQPPHKKRSKGPTQDPKALTTDTSKMMMTKKRTKKSLLVNSTVQNRHSDHQFVARSMGPPLAITWICKSPVDAIIEQFNQLDLNAKSSQEHNAFIACHMNYQEQHALVPYQRNGALIPFDSSFDQVKKSRPRPKVDLDDETSRVWKLLLDNINSEGIDGPDEEKEKWWEEERRVFRGRADSFIARMHLVQGDRRFSPWKGSVLDSVIGVFLTQNVSDHLSSSAFMSLAARFPLESESSQGQSCQEKVNITVKEPEGRGLDTDDTFGWNEGLNKLTCSEDSKMILVSDYNDIKEVNSVKSPGDSFIGTTLKDNLSRQLSAISKNCPDTSRESAVNESIGFIGDERDLDDTLSSQNSVTYSQNSADSVISQTAERTESCSPRTLEVESCTTYQKLSQISQSIINVHNQGNGNKLCEDGQFEPDSMAPDSQNQNENQSDITCSEPALHMAPSSGTQVDERFDVPQKNGKSSNVINGKELCDTELSVLSTESATQATVQKFLAISHEIPKFGSEKFRSSNKHPIDVYQKITENHTGKLESQFHCQENNYKMQEVSNIPMFPQKLTDVTGSSNIDNLRIPEHKEIGSNLKDPGKTASERKANGERTRKDKQKPVNWDCLRKQAQEGGRRERTANTMDSIDWEAVRCVDVNEIAETIKERGMNNVLAERIQEFLNRLVRDHGSIDLEWLRDVPPDKAKEYLLSVRGLGLKSVECVRLLTLHHLAFPVDTNVGRIAVRLGWVPLQPLPESLQLHLLELYPILESIQKFLWPRLCKLDQRTLYELHYQMITFGKVFCTKSKPNCNACPLRGECRHFASAFASARLALPGTEDKSIVSSIENNAAYQNTVKIIDPLQLHLPRAYQLEAHTESSNAEPIIEVPATPEPIIEVPTTPVLDQTQVPECDIEDDDFEGPDEIPTIQLNMKEFTHNLQSIMQKRTELQEGDMSKALVALTPEAASIPMPKLKNVSRLRTEHLVYELPDSHPLLQRMDKREPDDPSSYLLAIWTPGETADSIQPPERCISQESGHLCTNETCFSCNSIREGNSQTVRGTLLIPCRTAMRGSFPLNGTYFQVNEVFADHESSLNPINVPRDWLWNLPRRTVYFGTSIPTIFKGLSTEGIQYCFWRGFVCVRGFDWKTRAPRPLIARLHFPASKVTKVK